MATVTIRDLRNNFAGVAARMEAGEQITITRHGKDFATLSPLKPGKPGKVDWALRLAGRKPLGRRLSAKETAMFWSKLRD